MQENYDHYISKNIKALYRRRIAAPLLYLVFAAMIFGALPVASAAFPAKLAQISDMGQMRGKNDVYVSASLSNLKFTGYTKKTFGRVAGYFYYVENPEKNECCIALLSPSSCEQGLPEIESVQIRGKILSADGPYEELLENLAGDLAWTASGIRSKTCPFYLSEPDFRYGSGMFLFLLLSGSCAAAACSALLCLAYMKRPDLAPFCRKLRHFGNPKKLLEAAEEELATLPQLATDDMFITEHFFIELSKYGIAIVPIAEMVWIYKHSTLHKLFGHHFSISYTLHIVARHRVGIDCPKNIKSDIDGIIDYLAEANHDILVGFSEENRRKAGC